MLAPIDRGALPLSALDGGGGAAEAAKAVFSGTGTGARVCHACSVLLAFLGCRPPEPLPGIENREKPLGLTGDTEARFSVDTGATLGRASVALSELAGMAGGGLFVPASSKMSGDVPPISTGGGGSGGGGGGGSEVCICSLVGGRGGDTDVGDVSLLLLGLDTPKGATCGGLSLALNIMVLGTDLSDVGCWEIGLELPRSSLLLLCSVDFKGLSESSGINSSSLRSVMVWASTEPRAPRS